jgi:hypothetical protein
MFTDFAKWDLSQFSAIFDFDGDLFRKYVGHFILSLLEA